MYNVFVCRMSLTRRVCGRVCVSRALKPTTAPNTPTEEDVGGNKVAHIPREFAKDTIEFFRQSSPHVKSLLDLVFSAKELRAPLSEADEAEKAEQVRLYESAIAARRQKYALHEQEARRLMFDAIRNLPRDMYDEAVSKGNMFPPKSLLFHEMYKQDLMGKLSDWEMVKMQTFSNLMHIRYSHSDAKQKQRDRFFISESAALNLRKERAKKEKAN